MSTTRNFERDLHAQLLEVETRRTAVHIVAPPPIERLIQFEPEMQVWEEEDENSLSELEFRRRAPSLPPKTWNGIKHTKKVCSRGCVGYGVSRADLTN